MIPSVHVCEGVEFVLLSEYEARTKALMDERDYYLQLWLLKTRGAMPTAKQAALSKLAFDLTRDSVEVEPGTPYQGDLVADEHPVGMDGTA